MLVKRSTFAKPVIHERVHRLSCATHAMAVVLVATAAIINLRRLRDEGQFVDDVLADFKRVK